jgi:hypothetical protein
MNEGAQMNTIEMTDSKRLRRLADSLDNAHRLGDPEGPEGMSFIQLSSVLADDISFRLREIADKIESLIEKAQEDDSDMEGIYCLPVPHRWSRWSKPMRLPKTFGVSMALESPLAVQRRTCAICGRIEEYFLTDVYEKPDGSGSKAV